MFSRSVCWNEIFFSVRIVCGKDTIEGSAMATLGAEESGLFREVAVLKSLNKIECIRRDK